MNDVFSRSNDIKVAVIGGGTGSFTLLTGLKEYTKKIAALVNMADDGGSTGKLRDELGALPPGDIRQCLVALSKTPEMRDLFNYRFDEGSLKGHAFGNLFVTALEKMTGDFAQAVELAGDVLNITGIVEPITLSNVKLGMRDMNGKETIGEFRIAHEEFAGARPEFFLVPDAVPNPRAIDAIHQADIVVIAPGNLYGSLAPALLVNDIGQALRQTSAKTMYVTNLVTKPGQTDGFSVTDFADEVERLAGEEFLDVVLYNTGKPSDSLMHKYAKQGEEPVKINKDEFKQKHYSVVGVNLLAGQVWQNVDESDPIAATRTLIRHDADQTAKAIIDTYQNMV